MKWLVFITLFKFSTFMSKLNCLAMPNNVEQLPNFFLINVSLTHKSKYYVRI